MSKASDLIQRVQVGFSKLAEPVVQSVGEASEFVRKNPLTSAVAVSGGVLAGTTITQIVRKKSKARRKTKKAKRKVSRSKPKKRRKVSKKKKRSSKFKGRTSTRTNTSRSKVYYTKGKHQPYIILANGRAKFIKKSSASRMRKLKGGYK